MYIFSKNILFNATFVSIQSVLMILKAILWTQFIKWLLMLLMSCGNPDTTLITALKNCLKKKIKIWIMLLKVKREFCGRHLSTFLYSLTLL